MATEYSSYLLFLIDFPLSPRGLSSFGGEGDCAFWLGAYWSFNFLEIDNSGLYSQILFYSFIVNEVYFTLIAPIVNNQRERMFKVTAVELAFWGKYKVL